MTIVNLSALHDHASTENYSLAVARAFNLAVARGILACADKVDAPVLLATGGSEFNDGLLPSLEAMAAQARVPVAILGVSIENARQAVEAIRSGCQAVVPANNVSRAEGEEIRRIAGSCGITVVDTVSATLVPVDNELEKATLQADDRLSSSWQAFHQTIMQTTQTIMHGTFTRIGACGKGHAALEACEAWHPVEHLIIYNVSADETVAAELAAEGRRVLAAIPGVRAAISGRAVQGNARYQRCWLIRFADAAVIDSYRNHPDHVAYADQHFRPVADDRISIDYELEF